MKAKNGAGAFSIHIIQAAAPENEIAGRIKPTPIIDKQSPFPHRKSIGARVRINPIETALPIR